MLKITALMDDTSSEHRSLCAEHGLSLWIEYDGARFMFDFGASAHTLDNAKKLNVDVLSADFMLCSHSHYDHSAGFSAVMESGYSGRLITGPGFWNVKYAFDGKKYTYLGAGYDSGTLEANGVVNEVCGGTLELTKGCYVVGGFESKYSFEKIPERFVIETKDGFTADSFDDEICVVMETPRGLVVTVGCSHPGILNILSAVSSRFQKNIYAVIGGTHLIEADEARIAVTVEEMKKMGICMAAFSHCSGEKAEGIINGDSTLSDCHLAVGDTFIL